MAIPTPVNGQITDAVTQTNVKVLGDAPAMAMGTVFQSVAHSTGILYENATSSQQQLAITGQAATNQGVIQIYSVDTMAGAVATSKIAQSDVPNNMLALLSALKASTESRSHILTFSVHNASITSTVHGLGGECV